MEVVKTNERRQHLRIEPEKNERMRVDINGVNFIDILKASDVSAGGIGIVVPHGFEGCAIHERVDFVFEVPDQGKTRYLKLKGKISHISGERFGVTFYNMSDLDKFSIKRYIANKLKSRSLIQWLGYKVGLLR